MSERIDAIAFREGVYGQIYDAAYAVARNQSPDVAAHAEDIAMNIVLKFTKRQMTAKVENPAAWGQHTRATRAPTTPTGRCTANAMKMSTTKLSGKNALISTQGSTPTSR